MPEPSNIEINLRLNDRPGGDSGVLWDHHDALPHFIESMIHFKIGRERLDDDVVADAGVFINDRTLDFAVAANSERRAIGLVAIPVSTHHDCVPYFCAAPNNAA